MTTVSQAPEPGSLGLIGFGLAGLGARLGWKLRVRAATVTTEP
ncbi:MAG: PEP-CTERM sorting domain-containing protein [Bryobacteraceae bacterium]